MTLLELRNVEARYGPVKALHGVSLTIGGGELVAVLGANGAGKTTTLRAISGTVRRTGDLVFGGEALPRRPEGTARAGIAHVPEGRGTFGDLTVGRTSASVRTRAAAASRMTHGVSSDSSPGWKSADTSRRGPFPAASSRCSRSAAR